VKTIILEGPDGAGKSTLAKAFADVGYHIVPFGVPPKAAQRSEESIFHFFFDRVYEWQTAHDHPVVFDRFHLSDRIYGPLMRGGTPMTPRAEALIERYLEAIDAQVILCLPPRRTAFANWRARPGQEYVKDFRIFEKVYDGYVNLLFDDIRNRNFLWYDFTRVRTGSFVNGVKDWHGWPLPAGVVGSQRPKFLFIGERPGPGEGPDLPFVTPRNCSGWLFDAIREAGYEESEIAFANAASNTGTLWDLESIANDLRRRNCGELTIIALGKFAAERMLNSCACEPACHQLPHPQYAKRFESKHRPSYVSTLRKIRREAK
jgi:hypothetical protein